METAEDWTDAVEAQRRQKDRYFAEDPRSPIPEDQRAAFDGLNYYPVDPDYRFEVALDVYDEPEVVVVGTSTDGEQEYLAWGSSPSRSAVSRSR
ncbi:hypothetical protein SY89_03141 [Halolamina pelagica]|uniref:Uncharacterized protein n=1 Tax=Halolamina pelagica TaxID=699431 RepID=A0A0N8HZ98_9EURY|nr:hypothetical protein SY89_03141 [Halolamina pelagica]